MQCPSLGLVGACGGLWGLLGAFLRLLFKTDAVTVSGALTRKQRRFSPAVLGGLSGARACFQTRFRQAAMFKCEAERGSDVLDGRERVIKS